MIDDANTFRGWTADEKTGVSECLCGSFAHALRGYQLEAETRLQLDDAARQPGGGATEVDVVDIRARAEEPERREVQQVEGIEEIRPQLKRRVLAKRVEARQARALHEAQVNVAVVRPAKDVAPNAGRAIGRIRRIKVEPAAAGEVAV